MSLFYENSGKLKTARYEQTIQECTMLANSVDWLHYESFGKSFQGRDLPLLIADLDGCFTPEKSKSLGKTVVLVQACIHPGEPDGKDAGITLLRDMILNDSLRQVLKNITLLFIPIFSPDGHERFGPYNRINQNGPDEMGWRTNAVNLNLNRDFMKAEALEMQNWLMLFNQWLPHLVMDCHTTDGADYQYPLTYSLELNGNMDKGLSHWCRSSFVPFLEKKMKEAGMPIFPYVVFREWHDPQSGLQSWASPPMLSTGYVAIQNRIGLLIETHMLKKYETRVNATYKMVFSALEFVGQNHFDIIRLCTNADDEIVLGKLRNSVFPLRFEMTSDSTIVDFKGKKYYFEISELTGGKWFHYADTNQNYKIPYWNILQASEKSHLPFAYIIPVEYSQVIEPKLRFHGIQYIKLKKTEELEVESYKFKNVQLASHSSEGRQKVKHFEMENVKEHRQYFPGSLLVKVNQRAGRLVAHFFEPKGPDSFLSWGYFNSIFEQVEYGETYVMEKLARQMLENDTILKNEFEYRMKNDSHFASDQWAILNWFYNQSIYRDKHLNLYPIGMVDSTTFFRNFE